MTLPSGRTLAGPVLGSARQGWRVWARRLSAAVVAADAAYVSYEHQQRFAAGHGALPVPAALWPLSVDGLVILASLALLTPTLRSGVRPLRWRARWAVRAAFTLGITVSLVANIAAADQASWQAVLVAAWPPVALLLSVELLAHTRPTAHRDGAREDRDANETDRAGPGPLHAPREPVSTDPTMPGRGQAREVMWRYYQAARAAGHQPNGAELDRVAGTRDYGRAVLARWRREGRIPTDPGSDTGQSDTGEDQAA